MPTTRHPEYPQDPGSGGPGKEFQSAVPDLQVGDQNPGIDAAVPTPTPIEPTVEASTSAEAQQTGVEPTLNVADITPEASAPSVADPAQPVATPPHVTAEPMPPSNVSPEAQQAPQEEHESLWGRIKHVFAGHDEKAEEMRTKAGVKTGEYPVVNTALTPEEAAKRARLEETAAATPVAGPDEKRYIMQGGEKPKSINDHQKAMAENTQADQDRAA